MIQTIEEILVVEGRKVWIRICRI